MYMYNNIYSYKFFSLLLMLLLSKEVSALAFKKNVTYTVEHKNNCVNRHRGKCEQEEMCKWKFPDNWHSALGDAHISAA